MQWSVANDHVRDAVILFAYKCGYYIQEEIAEYFDINHTAVSQVV